MTIHFEEKRRINKMSCKIICVFVISMFLEICSVNISNDNDLVHRQEINNVIRQFLSQTQQLFHATGELQKRVLKLEKDNEYLSNTLLHQENVIMNISSDLNKVYIASNSVQNASSFTELKEEVSGLVSSIAVCQQKTRSISDDLTYMQNERLALENMVHFNDSVISRQLESLQMKIGFTVVNSHFMSNVADNQVIKFDNIVSNFGAGYDQSSGIFTATKSGIYMFYADLRSYKAGKICWIELVKNGNRLSLVFIKTGTVTNNFATSDSTLTVTHLNKGDKVWLEKKHYSIPSVCDIDDSCTFSGYRLN